MANPNFKRTFRYKVKTTLRRMVRAKQLTYQEARLLLRSWEADCRAAFPTISNPWDHRNDLEGMAVDLLAAQDRAKEAR